MREGERGKYSGRNILSVLCERNGRDSRIITVGGKKAIQIGADG